MSSADKTGLTWPFLSQQFERKRLQLFFYSVTLKPRRATFDSDTLKSIVLPPRGQLSLCLSSVPSTASNSPRSTPGSSPSLRRRVLGGGRASESEGGGEKNSGGGGADSPLPSIPSASSLSSAYPLASRHFSRNAKVLPNSSREDNREVLMRP